MLEVNCFSCKHSVFGRLPKLTGLNHNQPATQSDDILRLSFELSAGRTDTIGLLFGAEGARAPIVVWDPGPADLEHPLLRNFLHAAHAARDADGRVPLAWIDSPEFAMFSDWTMVLTPVTGLSDFHYDHYGPEIARAYGKDATGGRTSDFSGHIASFFLALYQAVIRRGQIASSEHEPPLQVFVRTWRRVIVPVFAPDGTVAKIAAINIPDNELRAGLDALPDAILVVDPTGRVCFANKPAFEFFEHSGTLAPGKTLSEFTGLDVQLPETPDDAIRGGPGHAVRHLVVRNSVIVPVQVTIGATLYRDTTFYIVSVRAKVG